MNLTVKVMCTFYLLLTFVFVVTAMHLIAGTTPASHPLSDAALKNWYKANAEYNGLATQLLQSLTPQQKQIQQQMDAAETRKAEAKKKLAEECAALKSVLAGDNNLDPTCPVMDTPAAPASLAK